MAGSRQKGRGGAGRSGAATCVKPRFAALRAFAAAILCVGLMIPVGLTSGGQAWADDSAVPPTSGTVADGAAIKADQQVKLRQRGETDTASVSLENVQDGWSAAITSVTVKAINGNDAGAEQTLTSDQYTVDAEKGRITFNRTEAKPIFSVAVGEGSPVDVTGRFSTTTYPQSKQYQITICAAGYADCVGTVTFYTGAAGSFYVAVDENGNGAVDAGEIKRTFTQDEIKTMSFFQNGSSQCGMTGFRTFSAVGVPVATLLETAGVSVSAADSFKLDTTDNFGSSFTYDQLFGTRYFLQCIYDDAEVKAVYDQVSSDAESGSDIALRRILAEKALEDNSTSKPMISANYDEVLISGEQVGTVPIPTADSVSINELIGEENQYRFTYGIKLVQEDVNVTFDDNMGGTAVQTVKSHLMTSTENTTIRSTYWTNGIIVTRGGATPEAPSTAADAIVKPADPQREGFVFAGWYTKNGSEDGDWGDAFDFQANDGTADEDITLYAKWVEAPAAGSDDGNNGNGSAAAGTDGSKDSSASTAKTNGASGGTVKALPSTGDSAPVAPMLCVAGAALLALAACLIARRKHLMR